MDTQKKLSTWGQANDTQFIKLEEKEREHILFLAKILVKMQGAGAIPVAEHIKRIAEERYQWTFH